MDKFTVACVQMRMRLPGSIDEYREDLRRFLRASDAKRARLVLFPELAGLAVPSILLRDRRINLVRRAESARRVGARALERVSGQIAGWLAGRLHVDVHAAIKALLDVEPEKVWSCYCELFGTLARNHGVTIVAPSAYLPGPGGGPIENRCAVFGPNGDLLATQSRSLGFASDDPFVKRGSTWRIVETEVGRAGIVVGSDVLYPEVGRLLAYQGADFLLVQGACPTTAYYNKLRAGTLARMQDNQLFAAASFLVGENPLRPRVASTSTSAAPAGAATCSSFVGRSAVFAPQELTPRSNGVQVEMGPGFSEGVITAEWDLNALRRLWETSDTPLRRALPPAEAALLMQTLYAQLRALPPVSLPELLTGPESVGESVDVAGAAGASEEVAAGLRESIEEEVELEMLPLLGSVTSHWPLPLPGEQAGATEESVTEWPAPIGAGGTSGASQIRREDETDEMDAVANQRSDGVSAADTPSSEDVSRSKNRAAGDSPAADSPEPPA